VFRSDQNAWAIFNSVTQDNFFDFVSEDFFNCFAKAFKFSFLFFESLFLIFSFFKVHSFFRAVFEFFSIEFFQLLDDILINWVNHIKNFVTFFSKSFNKWRLLNSLFRFTSNEVNIFLSFFHAGNIIFQRNLIFIRFASMISQKFSHFSSIL